MKLKCKRIVLGIVGLLVFVQSGSAQEFNCTVTVNAEQTGNATLQVFRTLERSLTEFINNTAWTSTKYKTEERIDCSMFINVNSFSNNFFTSTIQIQASRPVYGANYTTTLLNIQDKQFSFEYSEFQPLNYNPNVFENNLISVVAFYLYTILGVDADSFEEKGGTDFFEEAKTIVTTAQSSDHVGWKGTDGQNSRFRLNDDILTDTYEGYRLAMYQYHRQGLDLMSSDLKKGKEGITNAIAQLREMYNTRPNSYMSRIFFDAKSNEIGRIFSGGPSVDITKTVENLNRIAPTYADTWQNIKF